MASMQGAGQGETSHSKTIAVSLVPTLILVVAVAAVNLTNKQPPGECTDHGSTWLWVHAFGYLASAVMHIALMIWSANSPVTTEGPTALQKALVVLHGLVGMFNFAWWITGIVWCTQLEDSGCAKPGMDLMLTMIILPGVVLGLGCCAMCAMGGKVMAAFKGPSAEDMLDAMAKAQQQGATADNQGAFSVSVKDPPSKV